MGTPKERGEKIREATKEKILEAAVALFAKKGLTGTSAKDIAKNAGVSVGLMYHYYKTKEEMFDDIVALTLLEVEDFRKTLVEQGFDVGVKIFVDEVIAGFKQGLSFSNWMAILAQSTDFDRQLINELAKSVSIERAQLFVATLQGLCQMQLTLGDEFCIPTSENLISILNGGN